MMDRLTLPTLDSPLIDLIDLWDMEDMEHIFETLADIQNQLQNGVTSSSAEWLFGAKVKPQKATFKELNVDLSCIDLPVQAWE